MLRQIHAARAIPIPAARYTVGSVAALWNDVHASRVAFDNRMADVAAYVADARLPPALAARLTSYYERYLARRSAFDEDAILGELSEPLRREVVLHINAPAIASIPFFAVDSPFQAAKRRASLAAAADASAIACTTRRAPDRRSHRARSTG